MSPPVALAVYQARTAQAADITDSHVCVRRSNQPVSRFSHTVIAKAVLTVHSTFLHLLTVIGLQTLFGSTAGLT